MAFSGGEVSRAIDGIRAQAAAVAAHLQREIPAAAAGKVDIRVTTGDPARVILHFASELHADLIVIGVPPRGRVDETLFGSTLRRLVRRATSPVLVLPVVAGAHEWLVGPTR
jgi:nucleotide-binding universal stress UspA family protein